MRVGLKARSVLLETFLEVYFKERLHLGPWHSLFKRFQRAYNLPEERKIMQDFNETMISMKHHYQSRPSHTYAVPINVVAASEAELSEAAKRDIHEALKYAETKILDFIKEQGQSLNDIVQERQANQNPTEDQLFASTTSTQSFVQQMEQLKSQAEVTSGKQIDGIYDKLIVAGTQHPPAQPVILHKTQQVSSANSNALSQLNDVYSDVLNQGIIGPINDVGNAIGGAAKKIISIFGGIF